MKKIEVTMSESVLSKIMRTFTTERFHSEAPIEWRISDIVDTYAHILKCGLNGLNGKLTWNEVQYMLACVNGTFLSYKDIAFTVDAFYADLVDFEVYDKEQAEQFDVNAKELVAKLQTEHTICIFALLLLLCQCWHLIDVDGHDFKEYIEQHLKLRV